MLSRWAFERRNRQPIGPTAIALRSAHLVGRSAPALLPIATGLPSPSPVSILPFFKGSLTLHRPTHRRQPSSVRPFTSCLRGRLSAQEPANPLRKRLLPLLRRAHTETPSTPSGLSLRTSYTGAKDVTYPNSSVWYFDCSESPWLVEHGDGRQACPTLESTLDLRQSLRHAGRCYYPLRAPSYPHTFFSSRTRSASSAHRQSSPIATGPHKIGVYP